MSNHTNVNEYQTSDIGLCAALVASGFELASLDRSSQRVIFYICGSDKLEQSVTNYWSKVLKVSAISYFEALKQVKARLYGSN